MPNALLLGDLDGDGDLDAVTLDTDSQTVSVRFNNGAGQLSGNATYAVGSGGFDAALGDLDGDGDLDVVVSHASVDNTSTVLLNNGTGTFVAGTPINTLNTQTLALGDLDNDGDLDALFVNTTGNSISVRLNNNAAPLPVELVAFTATRQGAAARLQWATASEKNNAGFGVEASVDGHSFRQLGFVPGQGNSSGPRTYEFLDEALLRHGAATAVYYRLRQQDADGTTTYSSVRSVAVDAATAAPALYPNPAAAGTGLTLTGARPRQPLPLLDALGREVLRVVPDEAGRAELRLPAGLAPGVYLLPTPGRALRVVVTE
ncbi:FG-GAP-like repeat-containing protein [Hymenobacter ruricola]|uniref:VCBS repeat-containing protein n=1 Tax=Hymenobacter ruricola TaxID=2791023 RepID=A0ABS0I1V2_9BACT|nr:FG-GAP-like repeat-containing protein [Hymenobacter ruricola]MBF9220693.1 VCBS repeat-containing protein [Hymenobacter ruricola]